MDKKDAVSRPLIGQCGHLIAKYTLFVLNFFITVSNLEMQCERLHTVGYTFSYHFKSLCTRNEYQILC